MSHVVNLAQAAFLNALEIGTASSSDDDSEETILLMLSIDVPDAASNEARIFTFPPGAMVAKVRAFISKVGGTQAFNRTQVTPYFRCEPWDLPKNSFVFVVRLLAAKRLSL